MGMQVDARKLLFTSYRLIKKEVVTQSRRFHRGLPLRKNKRLLRERLRQRSFQRQSGAEMMETPRVLVLTGAGISAESGIRTFPRAVDGLGKSIGLKDVATPEGFACIRAGALFYNARRQQLQQPKYNPMAHLALAKLFAAAGDRFLLVTQNIDTA